MKNDAKTIRFPESSESCSHANTVEMFSGPTSVEDSKSYASYDHRSATDFPDDYRIYDVSHQRTNNVNVLHFTHEYKIVYYNLVTSGFL